MGHFKNNVLINAIMKKIYTPFLLVLILFFSTQLMCQTSGTPTDFGTTGETNNDPDDSAAPIDSIVWFLLISGICFVFYKQRVLTKLEKKKS